MLGGRVDLEKVSLGAAQYVTRETKLIVSDDVITDRLRYELRSHVLAHRLADIQMTFEVPKNWWQHLRQQLGLKAKLKTRAAHVVRYRTYPNADIVLPPNRFGYSFVVEHPEQWTEIP